MAVTEPSRQSMWAIIRQHCRVQPNPGRLGTKPIGRQSDRPLQDYHRSLRSILVFMMPLCLTG
jgi:hypothetical protein